MIELQEDEDILLGDKRPEIPKSITDLLFFITFFTILIEEKEGRPLEIRRER